MKPENCPNSVTKIDQNYPNSVQNVEFALKMDFNDIVANRPSGRQLSSFSTIEANVLELSRSVIKASY
jgi:hypothetical protein